MILTLSCRQTFSSAAFSLGSGPVASGRAGGCSPRRKACPAPALRTPQQTSRALMSGSRTPRSRRRTVVVGCGGSGLNGILMQTSRARVHGPWFWVQGSGSRVQGSGFRVQGSGSRVQGPGFRVQGSGLRVQGPGFRVEGPGLRVEGSGFRVQGQRRCQVRATPGVCGELR